MQPRSCSRRNCLTIRSSSEWNAITASRPPGRSISSAAGSARLERAELVVDGDPERLEDALGRMALAEARRRRDRGLDRVDELARALERLLAAAPARSRGRSGSRSAPRRSGGRSSASSRSSPLVHELARRSAAWVGSMRMSSGASAAYEKPRSGRSSCIEETPRSSRIASARTPLAASCGRTIAEVAAQQPRRSPRRPRRSARSTVRAVGSRSIAISLPLPCRSGGEQRRVAAGAEGRVDDGLARARRRALARTSSARTGT